MGLCICIKKGKKTLKNENMNRMHRLLTIIIFAVKWNDIG